MGNQRRKQTSHGFAITRDEAAPGGKNISRNWRSGCANANSRASKPRARFRERRGKSQKRTRDYERSYHSKALGRTASKYICKHPQRAIRKWEVNMEVRARQYKF